MVGKAEPLRGLRVRHYLLKILEENNCSMDRRELIERATDEVYRRYCSESSESEREECRRKAYKKVKISLRDAQKKTRDVQIWDGKVVLPRCIHMEEVSRGLRALLYTLDYVPPKEFEAVVEGLEAGLRRHVGMCSDYLEYLRGRGVSIEVVEDVEGVLKVFLEHIITSTPSIGELLKRVVRREERFVVLDLAGEGIVKLRGELTEVRREGELQRVVVVEGCCRRCEDLGLCSRCTIGEGDVRTVEDFVKILLAVACGIVTSYRERKYPEIY
jgi:hypothetical protein